jgi:hypothetical protein
MEDFSVCDPEHHAVMVKFAELFPNSTQQFYLLNEFAVTATCQSCGKGLVECILFYVCLSCQTEKKPYLFCMNCASERNECFSQHHLTYKQFMHTMPRAALCINATDATTESWTVTRLEMGMHNDKENTFWLFNVIFKFPIEMTEKVHDFLLLKHTNFSIDVGGKSCDKDCMCQKHMLSSIHKVTKSDNCSIL